MEKQNLFSAIAENKLGLLRLGLILSGIQIASLILGFAFFFITFGVYIALSRIIIYWKPTRSWFANSIGLKINEIDATQVSPFYRGLANIFHLVIALFFAIFGFYVIRLGINVLLHNGFLGQNFIYLIFYR